MICAFTYALLSYGKTLYAEIPEGHPNYKDRDKCIIQILKNLYGTKEGPMLWYQEIKKTLINKFKLFQILGTNSEINKFITKLGQIFEITHTKINTKCDFLGIDISKDNNNNFVLEQHTFITKLFHKYTFIQEFKEKDTPLPVDIHRKEFKRSNDTWYRELYKNYANIVGSMLYLRFTRPELLHAMQMFSTHTHNINKIYYRLSRF